MAQISPDLSGIVDGAVADAADFTTPINTIINEINGNLDNSNIKSGANISVAKLASSSVWATFTPSPTGYSGTPTTNVARWMQVGKTVFIHVDISGTSNANSLTFTLPASAKSGMRYPIRATDNGGTAVVGELDTTTSSTTATCYATIGSASWTTSGTKRIEANFFYEAA